MEQRREEDHQSREHRSTGKKGCGRERGLRKGCETVEIGEKKLQRQRNSCCCLEKKTCLYNQVRAPLERNKLLKKILLAAGIHSYRIL
jgi:hypothetical protein